MEKVRQANQRIVTHGTRTTYRGKINADECDMRVCVCVRGAFSK